MSETPSPGPAIEAPASRHFVSRGLRLHAVDWGNERAPTLVLLHGGRDHARSWDWVARRLRRDWHVVAPDLRGHGDSAWSTEASYDASDYVCDLARLLRELGPGPVSIVGHSLGGAIALRTAGALPERVRRVVAIEGLGLGPADTEPAEAVQARWRAWLLARTEGGGRSAGGHADQGAARARMRHANPRLSDAQVDHLTAHGLRRDADGRWHWKFDDALRVGSPLELGNGALHGLWRSIECPVLLVWGRESWAADPTPQLGRFRDARVAAFEDAGHWVQHDRLDAFVGTVGAFLAEG